MVDGSMDMMVGAHTDLEEVHPFRDSLDPTDSHSVAKRVGFEVALGVQGSLFHTQVVDNQDYLRDSKQCFTHLELLLIGFVWHCKHCSTGNRHRRLCWAFCSLWLLVRAEGQRHRGERDAFLGASLGVA